MPQPEMLQQMDEMTRRIAAHTSEPADKLNSLAGFVEFVNDWRHGIQCVASGVQHMRTHPAINGATVLKGVDPGEAKANLTIAYRHLEDARMRLGKAIQAVEDGVSCYDKAPAPVHGQSLTMGDATEYLSNLKTPHACTLLPGGALIVEPTDRPPVSLDKACKRPLIVAVCGSTRFIEEIALTCWTLEKAGMITLAPLLLPASYTSDSHAAEQEGVKREIDALFLKKVEMADQVFVYNKGGYIGDSTRDEIEHAQKLGKYIRYLEPPERAQEHRTQTDNARAQK